VLAHSDTWCEVTKSNIDNIYDSYTRGEFTFILLLINLNLILQRVTQLLQ